MTIILVRHALAVPRTEWDGDDARRPLTARGERQARALPPTLAIKPDVLLLSSPTTRCKATLRPLARELDAKVKTAGSLREGRGDDALDLVLDTVGDAVVCTHGDVVADVLRGLRRLGWPVPPRPRRAKGSAWVLDRSACTYLAPGA